MKNLMTVLKRGLADLQAEHNSETGEECSSKTRPERYIFMERKPQFQFRTITSKPMSHDTTRHALFFTIVLIFAISSGTRK